MIRPLKTISLLLLALILNTAGAHFDPSEKDLDALSPCVRECLQKDKTLHESILQERQSACLQADLTLHMQTLSIFMGNGRNKEYIQNEVRRYLDANTKATFRCLFDPIVVSSILVKMNEDSETTVKCLAQCSEADFQKKPTEDL